MSDELERRKAQLIEADHHKLMREAQVRTIMERPNFVQEEYEKWREQVGAPRQGQTKEEWQRSVLEHRILSAWVTEGRFHLMGRELNKAQQRIGRQRKANREVVHALKQAQEELERKDEALRVITRAYEFKPGNWAAKIEWALTGPNSRAILSKCIEIARAALSPKEPTGAGGG